MTMNNDYTQMLNKIFPEKSEPQLSELPDNFKRLITIAKKYTSNIPPIVIEENPQNFTGRLDYNHYNVTVIRIARFLKSDLGPISRTNEKMLRTLAHELGHVVDGRNWGFYNENFAECEKAAEMWKDILLSEMN